MRIHIVSLVFPPERGSARRIGELALSLANKGHTITVVTPFPSYPKGIVFPGYKKSLLQKEQWKDSVTVYRVYSYTSGNRQSKLSRALTYMSFTVFSLLGLLSGPRPDIVYVASPPHFLGLTGWFASILRGARFVLDVQDLWPDAPIALGYVRSKWMIRILQWVERFIYARASLVLTISETMRARVAKRTREGSKISLIYNWVDLDQYSPVDRNRLEARLGLFHSFVVLFAGNIGKAQNLGILLDAAKELKDIAGIQFVILGDGIEKARLQYRANELSLMNVSFLESVEEDLVPEYLGMADVLLVALGRAKHREAVIPSKLQVYMSSGKTILAAAEGATAEVVKDACCGLVVSPDDPRALAASVIRLKGMSELELSQMGQAGRTYAIEHFSLEHQIARIETLLSKVVPGGVDATQL